MTTTAARTKEEEKLVELAVYKCPDCQEGEVIVDWDAYNNLGTPIGFSEEAAREQRELSRRAFGKCGRCHGRGFILKEKK